MTEAQRRIFVQIASNHDTDWRSTIENLYAKASAPARVFTGLYLPASRDERIEEAHADQIRIIERKAGAGNRTGWARGLAQSLHRNEDYVLQIDPGMRFVTDWDDAMIALLGACGSDKPILTTYPPIHRAPSNFSDAPPALVRAHRFLGAGRVDLRIAPIPTVHRQDGPVRHAFVAGGFMFAHAACFDDVPHDPALTREGEDIAMAARLWTHGWDFFAPNRVLLSWCADGHGTRRREPADQLARDAAADVGAQRIVSLFGLAAPNPSDSGGDDERGLGTARTLAAYQRFSGLDFTGSTIAAYAKTWPFHLDADGARRLADGAAGAALSPSAHLFILDDESIVFSEPARELYAFNTAATYFWCALDAGEDRADATAGLAERCDVSQEEATRMADELLERWGALGLLAGTDDRPARLSPVEADAWPTVAEDALVEGVARDEAFDPAMCTDNGVARRRTYRLLSARVALELATTDLDERIHPVFAHLETDGSEPADRTIRITSQDGMFFVFVDGEPHMLCRASDELAPIIKGLVLQAGINSQEYFLSIHAGVVAHAGKAMLLPGAPGAGKTTTTAGLVHAGFRYLSDEVALLTRDSFEVYPVPVSVTIKETGLETVTALFPDAAQLDAHWRADGKYVRYLSPPAESLPPVDGRPYPIGMIAFPRYAPGETTRFSPVSKAEALRRLMGECLIIPGDLTAEDVAGIVRWVRSIDCCELAVASLDDAAQLLSDRMTA